MNNASKIKFVNYLERFLVPFQSIVSKKKSKKELKREAKAAKKERQKQNNTQKQQKKEQPHWHIEEVWWHSEVFGCLLLF